MFRCPVDLTVHGLGHAVPEAARRRFGGKAFPVGSGRRCAAMEHVWGIRRVARIGVLAAGLVERAAMRLSLSHSLSLSLSLSLFLPPPSLTLSLVLSLTHSPADPQGHAVEGARAAGRDGEIEIEKDR